MIDVTCCELEQRSLTLVSEVWVVFSDGGGDGTAPCELSIVRPSQLLGANHCCCSLQEVL